MCAPAHRPRPLKRSQPTKLVLPDLVSHCSFKLRCNRHKKRITKETKRWLFKDGNLLGQKQAAYHGLKAGLLVAQCYPDAAYPQLRVVNDFMTYLFHLDNLSDLMDNTGTRTAADEVLNSLHFPHTWNTSARVGKMTRDYWKRLVLTASPGAQQRFIETLDFFFQSVTQQASDRANGVIPDLESYISLRRDTSGCKPCWALIEYANNLDLPEEVMDHPVLRSLGEATNDLVTWSNDIFSYNVEQSKGDTHNMIPVVMNQYGVDLQTAIDFVGDLCKQSIDRFNEERSRIPSWSPEIDRQVAIYVDGLANWIVGSLHWSFETERYFGKSGREVKESLSVDLLAKRKVDHSEHQSKCMTFQPSQVVCSHSYDAVPASSSIYLNHSSPSIYPTSISPTSLHQSLFSECHYSSQLPRTTSTSFQAKDGGTYGLGLVF